MEGEEVMGEGQAPCVHRWTDAWWAQELIATGRIRPTPDMPLCCPNLNTDGIHMYEVRLCLHYTYIETLVS